MNIYRNNNNHTTFCVILCICLLIASCARIVMPKGGDIDVTPPKIIASNPKNNATNFNYNKIEITFDEYIVIDNVSEKLIISPPLNNKPKIRSRLRKLYIENIENLKENTTYIFDFADAISDYTEGNSIKSFKFAFSTGNEIDTCIYKGKIKNAFTHKPEKQKFVALYKTFSREYIRNNSPDYLTKSDINGNFAFEHIKLDDYFVIAFDDQNNNLIFDLKTENYGEALIKKEIFFNTDDSNNIKKENIIYFNEIITKDTTTTLVDSVIVSDTISLDSCGSLLIKVIDDSIVDNNLIFTLLDEKNSEISEKIIDKNLPQSLLFENLSQGKYRLRVIIDENRNNKFDFGDFDSKLSPEKVIFFDKIISIRQGWQTIEEFTLK